MNKYDMKSQCLEAKPYYYNYLCGQSEQIPEAVYDHIIDCPDCQEEVRWLEQTDSNAEELSTQNLQAILQTTQMQMHCALVGQPVRCSTIKPFLPILAIPEMAVRISTPVTEHIKACTECAKDLETLKQLELTSEQLSGLSQIFTQEQTERSENNTKTACTFPKDLLISLTAISLIMNRPDSGIVTTFRSEDSSASTKNQSYHVEVTDESKRFPSTGLQQTTKPRIPSALRRWWLKPIAAAAGFLIVVLLLFQSPSVTATDIGQIYEALKNVQNVLMTHYEVNNPDPIQEIWISRSLEIKLFKTNRDWTLFDINNKTRKSKTELSPEIQEASLDNITTQTVAATMDIPWGLLPFNKASELPAGAVWEKVQPETTDTGTGQTEIYDLFWTEKSMAGNNIYYQWRCHLDPTTKYPFKVEWWRKSHQDQDYELTTFTEITYPTQQQVLQVIEQAGL